jgi:hypothetical protein
MSGTVVLKQPRWIVGGLIALAALIVAVESLSAYVTGRLVVGIVAVVVLMGVLAIGLASLVRARRFIDQELSALGAPSPGGTLYVERRRKALELRRLNVAPDLDVLADATAADEADRGYTGKYLVATTVLIGLVGTFGGLMETLARIAPALKGGDLSSAGPTGALGLIAGPLAGLHVTFGTSVVAILVTLALALIQGDVTLHHERLLALLQERTRHVLLPELWPADESAAERTVRAVLNLRTLVAETLTRNAEENASKVAAVVRAEMQRLVEQVGGAMRTAGQAQTTALERTSATMTDSLRQVTTVAAAELRDAAAASQATTKATAAAAREAIEVAAAASREAMTSAAETIAATVRESDARAREDAARVVRAVEEAMAAAVTGLADATTRTSEAFTEAAAGAVAGLTAATTRTSDAFTEAAAGAVAGLTATTTKTSQAFTDAAAGAVAGLTDATTRTSEALTAATTRTSDALTEAAAGAVTGLAAATARASEAFIEATGGAVTALAAATANTSEAFTDATAGAVAALGELRGSLGAQLEGASQALTTAAGELHGTVKTLSPALAELVPQLGALGAEVALLAARAENPEQPNAVLDELVRLGEDVERLITLSEQAVAGGAVPEPEPAAEAAREPEA